jgi:murein DD-endopeptidase MepM/ murein hydrolase activator NlpD
MSDIKYHYNPKTFQYEPARISVKDILWYVAGLLFVAVLFFGAMITAHDYFFDSPTEIVLRKENAVLSRHKKIFEENLSHAEQTLDELKASDRDLYARLFDETPPSAGPGGSISKEKVLLADADDFRIILDEVAKRSDEVRQRSRFSSRAFASGITVDKEDIAMLGTIPAIQPIDNSQLDMLVSGYGERINPFHKGKHLHPGLDFAAPRGTAVMATAPGTVVAVNRTDLEAGYGNYVDIDHGNGFRTRYAHLETLAVRRGQRVTKSMKIGTVGSSGGSIAPHLHYEVIRDGDQVDPMQYLIAGISSDDHDRLVELSKKQNQSLD